MIYRMAKCVKDEGVAGIENFNMAAAEGLVEKVTNRELTP